MAKARPSNPSRIGKTLGAILSVPRRGALDHADDTDSGEVVSPGTPSASEPDAVPGVDTEPSPDRVPAAESAAAAASAPPNLAGATRAGSAAAATTPPVPTNVMPGDTAPHSTAQDAEVGPALGGGSRRKKRETFLVPEELADAMRNAIVHLSGPPLYYTLAEFGEHAIRNYIAQLEREHNDGRPFPRRPRAVRQGRPLR